MDSLGLFPKRKIWDSGGGGSVGETVSECMLTNVATASALDQLLLYRDVFAGTKKYHGHLPGHEGQFNAADWGKCCSNALL